MGSVYTRASQNARGRCGAKQKIQKKTALFLKGGFLQIYSYDSLNYSAAATIADSSSAGSTHPILPSARR